jgi:hypothetical protein
MLVMAMGSEGDEERKRGMESVRGGRWKENEG